MRKVSFFVFVLFLSSYSVSFAFEPAEAFAQEQAEAKAIEQAQGTAQARPAPEENVPSQSEKTKTITGFEVLSGFAHAKIHNRGNYNLVPLIFDLNFNLKPPIEKLGIKYWGLIQFQLEGFINTVTSPKSNVEPGGAFMFKIGFLPEHYKFQPYVKMGVGMLYMSQATNEQSTRFNFIEQGCAGVHYYLTKQLGLTFECRYRHLSNAGISHPNSGINTAFYLLGASYQF